ncbi:MULTISPECIES: hypothetical protein [unclassified Streptomyces]|uniref:RICIN domain-containing protein n=1 Tax=unclassified Streptomyces TaxID=2593676 RepID=UPI0034064D1B
MSVIGTVVGLALSLTLTTPGTATAAQTAVSRARFANYEYKQCIEENAYFHLWAQACDKSYGVQYWRWTGTTNTSSTLKNDVWDDCLDSNKERHVYTGECNSGSNQLWQVIQPAPASAIMLRNTATRLCLYQTYDGLYRTTECDRNDRTQRWTIG